MIESIVKMFRGIVVFLIVAELITVVTKEVFNFNCENCNSEVGENDTVCPVCGT